MTIHTKYFHQLSMFTYCATWPRRGSNFIFPVVTITASVTRVSPPLPVPCLNNKIVNLPVKPPSLVTANLLLSSLSHFLYFVFFILIVFPIVRPQSVMNRQNSGIDWDPSMMMQRNQSARPWTRSHQPPSPMFGQTWHSKSCLTAITSSVSSK